MNLISTTMHTETQFLSQKNTPNLYYKVQHVNDAYRNATFSLNNRKHTHNVWAK